jgi:precorrin-6B methylase 1
VQVAFAWLGLDWTGARLLSAHHHAPEIDAESLTGESRIAVLAGNSSTRMWIAALARRLEATHTTFICEDLTLPQERVSRLEADELVTGNFSSQSIVLFIGKKIRT